MENNKDRMMDIIEIQPNGTRKLITRVNALGEQKWRDYYESKGADIAKKMLFEPVLTEADNKAFEEAKNKLGFTQQPNTTKPTTKKK